MHLLGLLVSFCLASSVTSQDEFSGVYVSKDGNYSAILTKQELSTGDLFTPPSFGYEVKLTSQDQQNLAFENEVTLERKKDNYAFSSELDCDDPGCDYFQDFELKLIESEVPELKLSYSGFTYEDSDREERSWDHETVLTRAYAGIIKFLDKEEIVYSKKVQNLALEGLKKYLKEQSRYLVSEENLILSTVYKKVMSGRSVTALYVTTKVESLPDGSVSVRGPDKTQCDMVVVKDESSKWNLKYSDCYLGGKNVEFRP